MGSVSSVKKSHAPMQREAPGKTGKKHVRETTVVSFKHDDLAKLMELSDDSDGEEDELMLTQEQQLKNNNTTVKDSHESLQVKPIRETVTCDLSALLDYETEEFMLTQDMNENTPFDFVSSSWSKDAFILQNKIKIQHVMANRHRGDNNYFWETVCSLYMRSVTENGSWKDTPVVAKTANEIEELQRQCVEQTKVLESTDIYHSEKSLEALYKLCRLSESGARELGDTLVEKKFDILFGKIWDSLHATMKMDLAHDYNDTKEYLSLSLLKEATIAFAKISAKMCSVFGPNIIAILADDFSKKAYTIGVLNTGSSKLLWNSYRESLKRTLIIFYYMVKNSGENKSTMRELDFVSLLQPYLKSRFMLIRARALFLLVYIVNEDENEHLSTGNLSVGFLIRILEKTLKEKDHISRHYSFSTCEVVDGITALAVNDLNKRKFIEVKASTLSYLQQILENGLDIFEKRSAARAIWMLSFHPDNQSIIEMYPKMVETLDNLANQIPNQDDELRKACKGVLWQCGIVTSTKTPNGDSRLRDVEHQEDDMENSDETSLPHVMISYQWDVQPLTIRIKDLLKQAGYKVWIDVECIGGSTLEAMAKAVEESAVVLICLTEKYKESPSCRTEAEYTYKLRKPYVPLRMQEGYDADGWLGVMMGTKLWIDLSAAVKIDGNIEALTRELGHRGKISDFSGTIISKTSDELNTTMMSTQKSLKRDYSRRKTICAKEASAWNRSDVFNWLQKCGLESYKTKFDGYDGQRLLGLKAISSEAPDFFYNALKTDMGFKDLLDIVKFKQALDEIL